MSKKERYELALRRFMGIGCEHYTTEKFGECLRGGRTVGARYGADQACVACTAWAALYPRDAAELIDMSHGGPDQTKGHRDA